MTPEDLLRDALSDLAPTATADDTAFAGVRRAVARRRRRRTAARLAVVAAAVAVVAGVAGLMRDGDRRDDVVTQPAPTRPDPTTTGTDPTAATRGDLERVTFGGATFELPPGWSVLSREPSGNSPGGDVGETMCVGPVEPPEGWLECAGLRLHTGYLPGYEGSDYVPHGQWGWYHGTDVGQCPQESDVQPTPDAPYDAIRTTDAGYDPVESGTRPVGDRTAEYDRWEAICDLSGFTFSPRAWYLADEDLLIFDVRGNPETEEILASFRWQ